MKHAEGEKDSQRVSRSPETHCKRPFRPCWASIPEKRFKCARFVVAMVTVSPGWPASRRSSSKDGICIESVGRRRGDARLSQESPELRGLDDRVGR